MKLNLAAYTSLAFWGTHNVWGMDNECGKKGTLDFVVLESAENKISIEDDIRAQLKVIGFDVKSRFLSRADYNAALAVGDYHLAFEETWGAPYDPHAYASGWKVERQGVYNGLSGFEAPSTSEELFSMIDAVLLEENVKKRANDWEEIHNYVHQQAVMLGLWGKRIPTIMNKRLTGYERGNQEFDYPVDKLAPISGSSTVTINPAAQTGIFESVAQMEPHGYNPNEFFVNNWVYEGLVSYGQEGQILPSLAESWTIVDTSDGGQAYTFSLRQNVEFHDGTPWNCAAAKLNFDHVLAKPLTTADYHGWYGLPGAVKDWKCNSDSEFVVTTSAKYYPFLQELTFIRPLRMLSPAAFVNGLETDPITANSCPTKWGIVTVSMEGLEETVECVGTTNISGTGPFVFVSRDPIVNADGKNIDKEVVFNRNDKYWQKIPDIETLKVVRYDNPEDVKAALLDGTLDLVWGSGVLQARDIEELEEVDYLQVFHSGVMQNNILMLNSGKEPLDDITMRKTIIHAIDKKSFIDKELGDIQRPVDNVFPDDAPYCGVDLTPRWDYDIEKALLLGCPKVEDSSVAEENMKMKEEMDVIKNSLMEATKSRDENLNKKNLLQQQMNELMNKQQIPPAVDDSASVNGSGSNSGAATGISVGIGILCFISIAVAF